MKSNTRVVAVVVVIIVAVVLAGVFFALRAGSPVDRTATGSDAVAPTAVSGSGSADDGGRGGARVAAPSDAPSSNAGNPLDSQPASGVDAPVSGDAVPNDVAQLEPTLHRKALMAVGPNVIACMAEARVDSATLDPSIHGRLLVESDASGKSRVTRLEIVGEEKAPPKFAPCVRTLLGKVELSLPAGTRGVVVTPPFAGHADGAP